MSDPLRAITLPSRDVAFARIVAYALESQSPAEPAALESWLRRTYPLAAVRVRELSGETESTWYVYRDGTVTAEVEEVWWARPDAPHARLDRATGTVLEVNESLARLLNVPVEESTGRHYLYHVPAESREAVEVLFRTALALPELRSLVRLRRRGGDVLTLEFRSSTAADAIDAWFRPVGLVGDAPRLSTADAPGP